jgi:glycosyltransferase involved in cell wall biosynthesis
MSDLAVEHVVAYRTVQSRSLGAALSRLTAGATRTIATLRAMDEHSRLCAHEIDRGGFDVLLAGSCGALSVTSLASYVSIPSVLYLQEPSRSLYEARPTLPWAALPKAGDAAAPTVRRRLQDAARTRALRIQVREEAAGARAYDRVLVNSYFSRESLLRAYGVESAVCYLGVDTDRYCDQGLPRQGFVIGLGEVDARKRVDVVIRAIAQLPSPRPALVWVGNVGRQPYLNDVNDLAKRLDVDFTPLVAIPHEQVVRLLNEAAVLAYVSRLEPFGYAPLEAAACGLPTVAMREGGMRETIVDGETGLLVDSEADLCSALERLAGDEPFARRMGAAARRRVEATWSLAAATDRLDSHLVDVVDRTPRLAPV